MVRRSGGPELQVRFTFEVARIAPQCLAEAYEHLVPIPRRPTRPVIRGAVPPDLAVVAHRLMRRSAERE